ATQPGNTAKMFSSGSMLDEYEANGFVDDDDDEGGNTSTSQDIADFELELDEEPIQFIGDEEYKSNMEAKTTAPTTRTSYKGPTALIPVEPEGAQDQLRLLQKNTNHIQKAAQINKVAADLCGFGGIRKGCFDE